MVVGMDGRAPRGEPGGQLLVAPAVLCVAVDEEQRAVRLLGQPGATEEDGAVGGAEVGLDAA
jgi:hypothetical protein